MDDLSALVSASLHDQRSKVTGKAWFTYGTNMISRGLEWITEERKPEGVSDLLSAALENCYLFASNRGVGAE